MMEMVDYGGWRGCIRLFNRDIDLIVTTAVGPRIIRCGFINDRNLFYESADDRGKTGGEHWRIYGGHRLWHAPEANPRTYFPDNQPVEYNFDGSVLKLMQPAETTTGLVKEIDLHLDPEQNKVTLIHRLRNNTHWTIQTAPWAITAHAPGSRAILPQEPYVDPALDLLPSRPVVLWKYTRMSDSRWTFGDSFIQLRHDGRIISEQKAGILNKQGWCAVILDNTMIMKHFSYLPGALYPDFCSNNEVWVNGLFLETESLGPLTGIEPGASVEHEETWIIVALDKHYTDLTEERIGELVRPFMPRIS